MNIRYIVKLTSTEREALEQLVAGGTKKVRKVKRAQILLAADRGIADADIAATIGCGTATIYRIKKAFVDESLERALNDKPRPGARRKLSGREEALLVALACSSPPPGRARWTLKLLADDFVKLEAIEFESVSAATVGRRLAEKEIKPSTKISARGDASDCTTGCRGCVAIVRRLNTGHATSAFGPRILCPADPRADRLRRPVPADAGGVG